MLLFIVMFCINSPEFVGPPFVHPPLCTNVPLLMSPRALVAHWLPSVFHLVLPSSSVWYRLEQWLLHHYNSQCLLLLFCSIFFLKINRQSVCYMLAGGHREKNPTNYFSSPSVNVSRFRAMKHGAGPASVHHMCHICSSGKPWTCLAQRRHGSFIYPGVLRAPQCCAIEQ